MEILWLLIAVTCLILGFYRTFKIGLGQSYIIFILSVVAFIMYTVRRYIRKSHKNTGTNE
jgi:hypothetical protein